MNLFHHTVMSPNEISVFPKIVVTITICIIGKVFKRCFFLSE